MYAWFNEHLALGHSGTIVERDYQRLTREEMSVWDNQHPRPAAGDEVERALLQTWRKLATIDSQGSRDAFRAIFRRDIDSAGDAEFEHAQDKQDRGAYVEMHGTLHNKRTGESVSASFLYPDDWGGEVVLWLHPDGGDSLFSAAGAPVPNAERLLEGGRAIAAIDQLFAGAGQTRKVANPREFAGYTLGYNDSLFVQRTHDILTTLRFIRDDSHGAQRISMIAFAGCGPTATAARLLAGDSLHRTAIDNDGFSFAELLDYRDPNFLPGASKYGGIAAMTALGKSSESLFDPQATPGGSSAGSSMVDWLLKD
jgi:hypothetical protein